MDEERPIRLRPRRPRSGRNESKMWARGFQQLMHLARMTAKLANVRFAPGRSSWSAKTPRSQRCAVRVTYTPNRLRGQWAAHGRYIVRDSASALRQDGTPGFGPAADSVDLPRLLATWQKSGDERLFKLILSPEFGDRLDLERLTRDVMGHMEHDLGQILEWVAVVHRNTDHPHVHVVLRGTAGNTPLRLDRDYIRHGIRQHAESACTRQLGYRTALDLEEAERREISQARFTSLDRLLAKEMDADPGDSTAFQATRYPDASNLSEFARSREQRLVARLNYLCEIGLAERNGPARWRVRRDLESVLRTFQRAQDRQKMLGQYAAFLSDPRLQYRIMTPGTSAEIEGRVIAHAMDDISDGPHVLIESVDGVVYYLAHDAAIAEARANGKLRPNSFVQIREQDFAGQTVRTVADLGDADQILTDRNYWRDAVKRLLQRGAAYDQRQSWAGWLGRYHAVLHREATRTQEPFAQGQPRQPGRRR